MCVLPHRIQRRTLLGVVAATAGVTLTGASRADDDYALDDVSRKVAKHGRVVCPDLPFDSYRGTHIRYKLPAKIFEGFRPRLVKFEKVARELAIERYGRAPTRLVHLGTYNCRRISAYPEWLSEHALGNAIDIAGFDFGALPSDATMPEGMPAALRRPFVVRVVSHWKGTRGVMGHHAEFLHTLARRLIARHDIFRVLLGPAWPGHHNHFHFDMAPFRMVEIFDGE